jgi:hypothetical protein
LHRCLQRHGISRLPKGDREKPKKFKDYEIGYFHIDIAELRCEGGKAFSLSRLITPASWCSHEYIVSHKNWVAAGFLRSLIRTVPYRIHTILTDNGVQFVQREQGTGRTVPHIFGRVALENNIEHRLTNPYHP